MLLLDELDAIAKRRDDVTDEGPATRLNGTQVDEVVLRARFEHVLNPREHCVKFLLVVLQRVLVEHAIVIDARVKTGASERDGLNATDGINKMRDVLRTPGRVVRLVGLSGVGKPRLVEALFDERIGKNSLDSTLAIYTDIAESPDPQPTVLATNLIAAHSRAILVIDNCPPDIHRQLSEVARIGSMAPSPPVFGRQTLRYSPWRMSPTYASSFEYLLVNSLHTNEWHTADT